LIQYRSVTDRHTHTHRHTTTAYTALSNASRGKNGSCEPNVAPYLRFVIPLAGLDIHAVSLCTEFDNSIFSYS